jgi:hypothetical protein
MGRSMAFSIGQSSIPRYIPSPKQQPRVLCEPVCFSRISKTVHSLQPVFTSYSSPVKMAKLASFLLAIARLTSSVYGLPAGEAKLYADAIAARAITLPSDVPVTTSYSTAIETLQSASTTGLPSFSGVRQTLHIRCAHTKSNIEYLNWATFPWVHERSG